MLLLIVFAFLAGIVTIFSPCILPVLPIILSASVGSGRRRPLGIVFGFVLSFTFFTLALTAIVKATGLSADALRLVAVVVIGFFGLSLLFPQTQVLLERVMSAFSGLAGGVTAQKSGQTGFWGGVLIGLSLGLLWTPCVGPILAAVITLAITQTVNAQAMVITLAYSLGSALPMLGITYASQRLLQQVRFLNKYASRIQQGFGVVMILTAVAILLNLDRQFQTAVLQLFPQYGSGLTAIENTSVVQQQLQQFRSSGNSPTTNSGVGGAPSTGTNTQTGSLSQSGTPALSAPTALAPDFTGGGPWINSGPLSISKALKGKVVLVDFWTYSCINCIRTMPYLKKWYATYKDQGLVIVGVHSPEFAFEHDTANVTKAVHDFGLTYPIVQDNDFAIWKAYSNSAWPAHYLIDKNGYIRDVHFGEGNYVETENAIRTLLNEPPITKAEPAPSYRQQTPETYLGYGHFTLTDNGSYSSQNTITKDQAQLYYANQRVEDDAVALAGNWIVTAPTIQPQADGAVLKLNFLAQQVYLVMDNPAKVTGKVQVLLDGKPLPAQYQTADTDSNGMITVTYPRKYDVLDLKQDYGRHEVELIFPAGIGAYSFTFGS